MADEVTKRSQRRKIALWSAASLAVLFLLAVVTARLTVHGPALADVLEAQINQQIRGRVSVQSLEWPVSSALRFALGGWIPVTARGVTVYDEGGEVVLEASHAEAELDAHALLLGRRDLVFRHLKLLRGGYARIHQVADPSPYRPIGATTIGLVSAFQVRHAPYFDAGISARPSPVIELSDFHLANVTLELDFPSFSARLHRVSASGGYLLADSTDPLAPKLYYSLSPRAERGRITVAGQTIFLRDVEVDQLRQLPTAWPRDGMPHHIEWTARAQTQEGAVVKTEGAILEVWTDPFGGDYDIHLTIDRAGAFVDRLSSGTARGDELAIHLAVTGPVPGPRIELGFAGLELAVPVGGERPPLHFESARAHAVLDLGTGRGSLAETAIRGAGGEVRVAADFAVDPYQFAVEVTIPEPLDLGAHLPRDVKALAGHSLRGRLHARGDEQTQQIDQVDLWLGRANLRGQLVRDKGHVIRADTLRLTLGKTAINSRGWVDFASRTFDVALGVASADVPRYLRHVDAPALAEQLSSTGWVRGSFADPRAHVRLSTRGTPVVDQVGAELGYRNQLVTIADLRSDQHGASVRGSGRIHLGDRSHIHDLQIRASKLDLARVPGLGNFLRGLASAELSARGPLARPQFQAHAESSSLEIAGDTYENFDLRLEQDKAGAQRLSARLQRQKGGNLDLSATLAPNRDLSGHAHLEQLPIQTLAVLGGKGASPLGGTLSADLTLGGTATAPNASGTINLWRFWFQHAFFGTGVVNIEPEGRDAIRISGDLFRGRVKLDGTVQTRAPYWSDLNLEVRRVELDRLFPELAERYRSRGWISGEIALRVALAQSDKMEAVFRLTEAMFLVENEDASGRPAPIRLRSRKALHVQYDGTKARFLEEAEFEGPGGILSLSGWGTTDQLAFRMDGILAVKVLQPYLRDHFDYMDGALALEVDVTGSAQAPRITGTIQFDRFEIRPVGQDAVVKVPSGKVQVANDQIAITGFSVFVDDQYSRERAELVVKGGVALDSFVPVAWALRLEGELAGKMLLVAAPDHFSAAGGRAALNLSLIGQGEVPDIDGTLEFDPSYPFTLTPRGLRHQISFTEGVVTFTDRLVRLEQVGGWFDEEGRLSRIDGEISLENWRPVDVDITVDAERMPLRIPRTLDLTVNLRKLEVVGDRELDISGEVEVIDGRYTRNFNLLRDALIPQRTEEVSKPFYQEFPPLANARLKLSLKTRAFFVQNNLANIAMNGSVEISGTPTQPQLDGSILVEGGTFKLPTIRATFTHTTGSVAFSPTKRLPEQTPELNLRSESTYRDTTGQDHLVTLTIKGPLSSLDWDLTTNTGLNKGQTATLLFAGKTAEEVRHALGDQAIGRATALDRTAGEESNTYDQLVKDLAGDFISLLLEDKLRDFTKLDVARLEIGTTSVGVHVEKNFFKNLRVLGDLEKTLRGLTWDVRGQLRLADEFSVEGEFLDKDFNDDSEEDISDGRLRFVWRRLSP